MAEPAPDGTVLDAERLYQTSWIRNRGKTLLTIGPTTCTRSGQRAEVGAAACSRPGPRPTCQALFGRLRGMARPMTEGKPGDGDRQRDGDPDTPLTILTDEVP